MLSVGEVNRGCLDFFGTQYSCLKFQKKSLKDGHGTPSKQASWLLWIKVHWVQVKLVLSVADVCKGTSLFFGHIISTLQVCMLLLLLLMMMNDNNVNDDDDDDVCV